MNAPDSPAMTVYFQEGVMKKNEEVMYIAYSALDQGEQVVCWADSIEELSTKMNVSKSTIYRHIKDNDGRFAKVELSLE